MDSWHFGTDPDPRIRTTGFRIRSLLLFFRGWQDSNKTKFFVLKVFCLLLFEGTFTSVFKYKKSKRSQKIVEIKFFLFFCLLLEGSCDLVPEGATTYGSGSTTLITKAHYNLAIHGLVSWCVFITICLSPFVYCQTSSLLYTFSVQMQIFA